MQNEHDYQHQHEAPLEEDFDDYEGNSNYQISEEEMLEEEALALEREQTINARKSRQKGNSKTTLQGKLTLAALAGAGILLLLLLMLGPTTLGKALGLIDGTDYTGQSVAEIDNIITKKRDDSDHGLSLDIPYEPEEEIVEAETLDAEARKLIEDLRAEIESLKNRPAGGLNQSEIRAMLEAQADQLRKEAEEKRRTRRSDLRKEEEAAKKLEEARKRALEIEARQTTSSGLILDKTREGQRSPGAEPAGISALGTGANQSFLSNASVSSFDTAEATSLGNLSRIVVQGTIISAVLETAINTELPGSIRAKIIEPVYSYNGEKVLIPAGTRLIGTFNNSLATAQSRLLIAWNRAITPQGLSIAIGSAGVDTLGRSGTAANVNNRYRARFGSSILISIISALPALAESAISDNKDNGIGTNNTNENGLRQSSSGTFNSLSTQSQQAVQERLSLPPVLRVPQGEEIRVFVNRDLVF